MLIIWGTRFYGRIRSCGRSFIATRFAHVWFIPLFPVGSQLVLEENGSSYRGIPVDINLKSVLAGYLRIWGPIGVIASIFMTLEAFAVPDADPIGVALVAGFGGLVTIALIAAVIVAWAVMGKLSDDEKRQRSVYAMHTGYFVDPADMGSARASLRENLLQTVTDRVRGLAAMGYRISADPAQAWPHVAMDPTHNDDALITAAFTLARLESAVANGAWKVQMDQVHQNLWQRIRSQNAPYLNAALAG